MAYQLSKSWRGKYGASVLNWENKLWILMFTLNVHSVKIQIEKNDSPLYTLILSISCNLQESRVTSSFPSFEWMEQYAHGPLDT